MAGVRSSKTVNGTIYNFTTLGGLVMRQTWGTADSPKSVISFVYDDAGQPYAMRYKQAGETSTSLYYYILNVQGDVVGLMNSTGTQVVQYSYDPWGKLLGTSIKVSQSNANYALYEAVAEANPLRYRGYYFDTETGFYYLQTRYYDPAIGRFINADTFATTDIDGLLSTNMFAYCENNPVMGVDPTGTVGHLLVGAAVGTVTGLLGQVISDVTTSLLSGELTISNWQTYAGAAIGGAVGGAVFAATGNSTVAGAASGFATTFTSGALQKSQTNRSWGDIAAESVCDGAMGAYFGKLGDGIRLKGKTSGRNSWGAVYKSGLKKLKNKTAKRMSYKVMKKGFGYSTIGGLFMDLYYGAKQYGCR